MGTRFATTNWTLVLQARDARTSEARGALAELCEAYWYPVYAFIRSRGFSSPDAEDLTQAYFTRFLDKGYVKQVRPEAGRFRSFLLVSVRHFLSNERDRERAFKRGGGRPPLSLDVASAEARLRGGLAHEVTPEALFEQSWAAVVLERTLGRLRAETAGTQDAARHERLSGYLTGDGPGEGYAAAARELGLSEGAVRVAVHRLRRRFGALLREEIGRTLADEREIDAEIRHLLGVVGRSGAWEGPAPAP